MPLWCCKCFRHVQPICVLTVDSNRAREFFIWHDKSTAEKFVFIYKTGKFHLSELLIISSEWFLTLPLTFCCGFSILVQFISLQRILGNVDWSGILGETTSWFSTVSRDCFLLGLGFPVSFLCFPVLGAQVSHREIPQPAGQVLHYPLKSTC